MADRHEVVAVAVAAEFVVTAAVVLLLVPFEAAAPVLPLFLVFSFGLYRYLA